MQRKNKKEFNKPEVYHFVMQRIVVFAIKEKNWRRKQKKQLNKKAEVYH